MEHLNRLLKDAISHLGANKTPPAILRASKAIGVVKDILCQFDATTGVWFTGKHTRRSENEDLKKVITELSQRQVFSYKCGRAHHMFPSFKCSKLLKSMNKIKFQKWMSKYLSAILNNPHFPAKTSIYLYQSITCIHVLVNHI